MTNVVLYIRVSTPEQAEEGFSLAAQETELRAYCDKKGYNVAAVYQDAGLSGKDIEGRPELRKLLHDVTAGSFDAVIVWSLSRFTRSLSDLCSACDHIEKYGCYLQSYTETFDARTPTGRMIRGILAVVAQWQREIITDNVRLALRQRATEGYPTTFCILGYDYDKQTGLIINSNEASVVQTVASTYLSTRNLLQTQVV